MPDQVRINDFRLKGNASFVLREGWLAKGLRNVEKDPTVFSREDATTILGVGSAMVNSIKHWLLASGLVYSKIVNRKTSYFLTTFAKIIRKHDPYFEDLFTLYLVHYKIASNIKESTVWYLLFNHFDDTSFTDKGLNEKLLYKFRTMTNSEFSTTSFSDDCSCALRTYMSEADKDATPEDNNACPLSVLGLFERTSQNTYERTAPPLTKLSPLAVLYVILDRMDNNKSIPFSSIMTDIGNAGRTFHLTPYMLNVCLDDLQAQGLIEYQRTSGLNMIYPRNGLTPSDTAEIYYTGR